MYPNNIYGNYYPQAMPQQRFNIPEQQPQGFSLKGHPVTSIDEARASMIDFDGSVFYFPDVANGRIYTKQIGVNGNAIVTMYEQKDIPAQPQVDQFVTKEELQQTITELRQYIEQSKIVSNF